MNYFERLSQFISREMSMSHVYQPVMLKELLKQDGVADEEQIAAALLERDPTQIDYYIRRVRSMVGKVLSNRGVTKRTRNEYSLVGYETLTEEQIEFLIQLCEEKLNQFETQRGGKIWEHRATDRQLISGSVRYQVLTRAAGRCECCGASVKDKAIDVDHIVPRSLGGKNDISNYQALCWECNTNKGNKDNTSFAHVERSYSHREADCLFCELQMTDRSRIIKENTLAYAILDGFPVTEGHTLFIPKRHVADYFGLTQAEFNAVNALIADRKAEILSSEKSVGGFNIGANAGELAGQTVFHCHIHLIPRRSGDVENPRGGVRHIIPGKGYYQAL